jgi:hypothetical protein
MVIQSEERLSEEGIEGVGEGLLVAEVLLNKLVKLDREGNLGRCQEDFGNLLEISDLCVSNNKLIYCPLK